MATRCWRSYERTGRPVTPAPRPVSAGRCPQPAGSPRSTASSRSGRAPWRTRAPSSSTTPSYTQQLLADRNLRLKKLGEEATELTVACADEDGARAAAEAADLFYHALVALHALGVGLDDVAAVLSRRRG